MKTALVNRKQKLILWFKDIGIKDIPLVGGKNAGLGEMYRKLVPMGIKVPNGFTVTAHAYDYFLKKADLKDKIQDILDGVDTRDVKDLRKRGESIRRLILRSELPKDLVAELEKAYISLGKKYGRKNVDVAIRSSATAEDLPGASFAGQQETYLNVVGIDNVSEAVKKCFASLFTNRAISYRKDKGFSHFDISLSVGVQKMVRSDKASSGVMFTIDTETGLDSVVIINSSYGLGEMIVQGEVIPDEFTVFKPTFKKGFASIIERNLGEKKNKIIYSKNGIKQVRVQIGRAHV